MTPEQLEKLIGRISVYRDKLHDATKREDKENIKKRLQTLHTIFNKAVYGSRKAWRRGWHLNHNTLPFVPRKSNA